jgi:hypothetical protein
MTMGAMMGTATMTAALRIHLIPGSINDLLADELHEAAF